MTQAEQVLDYIKTYGSITSLEAFNDLGITRISARVFELRKQGYNIYGDMEKSKNRFGKIISYKRYKMEVNDKVVK